ncbi:ATP-binding protein, partial [Actinomyces slackii]|uniref:ATP-binding protein n=1 Tax=Actinomyces slackii TaxID=52774 RepID=UPI0039E946D9
MSRRPAAPADPTAAQHRLARVQVHNWGTFGGYHDLPVPRRGLVITGPSGSGKS